MSRRKTYFFIGNFFSIRFKNQAIETSKTRNASQYNNKRIFCIFQLSLNDVFNTEKMKVKLVCIHKTNAPWINAGLQEFGKRLSNYISFEHIEIEINTQKFKTREALMSEEGKKVNQILKKTDYLILLDEGGKEFSSIKFADWINKKFVNVNNDIVFLVGGAYGFNDDLRSRANESISLSKMTFTHQMARLFFTEQLYRAMTILKNEPYHHQ